MGMFDDFKAVYDKLNPTLWYIVSEHVPPGRGLVASATDFFPTVYYFHPDDWARVHRELSEVGYRLRDFRAWGAKPPTTIEGEAGKHNGHV